MSNKWSDSFKQDCNVIVVVDVFIFLGSNISKHGESERHA